MYDVLVDIFLIVTEETMEYSDGNPINNPTPPVPGPLSSL